MIGHHQHGEPGAAKQPFQQISQPIDMLGKAGADVVDRHEQATRTHRRGFTKKSADRDGAAEKVQADGMNILCERVVPIARNSSVDKVNRPAKPTASLCIVPLI